MELVNKHIHTYIVRACSGYALVLAGTVILVGDLAPRRELPVLLDEVAELIRLIGVLERAWSPDSLELSDSSLVR